MPAKRLVWHLFPQVLTLLVLSLAALALIVRLMDHTAARVIVGGLAVLAFAWTASWLLARTAAAPLGYIKHAVDRFAAGDWDHRLLAPDSRELLETADALNDMARHVERRMAALARRNHEQEAVLTSMVEGVLAVDNDQRVISVNAAAARLLGAAPAEIEGRGLQEVVRNADLRRFVFSALAAERPIEGNLVLRGSRDQVLQANGTALRDAAGRGIGAVIVLNDVSRLRQLENIRRDFAANVSHELRTPIASIKGFVETLLDGALAQPQEAERFLQIIARQADRLNTIIDDLLSLSRIEQEAQRGDIVLATGSLCEVAEAAARDCAARAAQRQIEIKLDCVSDLPARINAILLEQAIINLVDNAIQYSEAPNTVELSCRAEPGEAVISVRDHGCGIAEEHLPRLFERFYRVDKARSRKLGGTGLGLAIVKHIALAHHGRVTVESVVGQGSTFSIRLPL
ncbi:MAG TPA: ATP-binding protein [Pirellulales bacterium]|nr:ATP-binding protein [Pirellulales bacterium]